MNNIFWVDIFKSINPKIMIYLDFIKKIIRLKIYRNNYK